MPTSYIPERNNESGVVADPGTCARDRNPWAATRERLRRALRDRARSPRQAARRGRSLCYTKSL